MLSDPAPVCELLVVETGEFDVIDEARTDVPSGSIIFPVRVP